MTKRNRKPEEPKTEINNAFLKEVDDALHYDRMQEIWNKYKEAIVVAILGLFLVASGWTMYKNQREKSLQEQATKYWTLTSNLQNPELNAELADFSSTADSKTYRMMSSFVSAQSYAEKGEVDSALEMYRSIVNLNHSKIFNELAMLNQAYLLADNKADEAMALTVELDEAMSYYRPLALELQGYLYEKEGDNIKAMEIYENIISMTNLPNGLKSRVESRLSVLNRVS